RTCSILLSQPASFLNISLMELSVIIGGVTGIILLIIFIFIIRKCCMRRRRAHARIINETRKEPVLLNSARPHELTELKRSSKLINLEVNKLVGLHDQSRTRQVHTMNNELRYIEK
ncbi:hypothetical protein CBL_21313, partial [Carabus blaptoides fortunei]